MISFVRLDCSKSLVSVDTYSHDSLRIAIDTLNLSEIKKLIARRCQDRNYQITEEEVNQVLGWGGCHPYLTNQILNAIFMNRDRENPFPSERLFRSLVKQHRQRDFAAWWDEETHSYGFGQTEQKVYLALIEEGRGTAETLEDKICLSPGTIEDALAVLAGTGVIRQLDYETYAIGTKLFERWVIEERKSADRSRKSFL